MSYYKTEPLLCMEIHIIAEMINFEIEKLVVLKATWYMFFYFARIAEALNFFSFFFPLLFFWKNMEDHTEIEWYYYPSSL